MQKDAYALELSRYVVLNPVRAGMVEDPQEWPWSSCRAVMGSVHGPEWLDTEWLLSQFGHQRSGARRAWRRFVLEGVGEDSPLNGVRDGTVLGDNRSRRGSEVSGAPSRR